MCAPDREDERGNQGAVEALPWELTAAKAGEGPLAHTGTARINPCPFAAVEHILGHECMTREITPHPSRPGW